MREIGIETIYRRKSLSKLGRAVYIKPYLLRGLRVDHRNQVWCIDITYIPMKKGFMYLTAIIDVHSRYIVGWGLHNTLDASNCIEVLERAISKYGVPEIINSDQGRQFTSKEWTAACAAYSDMKVSMDGRGRAKDRSASRRVTLGSSKNIWIERFWKTIRYEYIYILPDDTGSELYHGISKFVDAYNHHRRHQGINHMVPGKIYLKEVA